MVTYTERQFWPGLTVFRLVPSQVPRIGLSRHRDAAGSRVTR
jgi:hypothetical protein